jgi:hypothetical protein
MQQKTLLDDLVGADEQHRRHVNNERLEFDCGRLVRNSKEVHWFGQAFQVPFSTIRESEVRTCDKVLYRSGNKAFSRRGLSNNARRNMDGYPAYRGFMKLDLSGMNSGAYFHSNISDGFDNRQGTMRRPCRTVEGRKKSIARCLHLVAPKSVQFSTDKIVVHLKQSLPTVISERFGPFCRGNDIGEQDRRQHTVERCRRFETGQELLDAFGNGLCVIASPGGMVHTLRFEKLRVGDQRGDLPTAADVYDLVVTAVNDQGRYADRRQYGRDVDFAVHLH